MIKPKISIIMGMYNTKEKNYLELSLNSILNQTYKNFELIICDDGSTNDCLKWAQEICAHDPRVKFLKNSCNKGLAYTLNVCLKNTHGEYIARMDDDDESLPNRLEKQIEILENNPDIDVVSSNVNLFNQNGIYGEMCFPKYIKNKDFLFNSPIVHPSIMCRQEVYTKVNGYRDLRITERVEDYDLFMRIQACGFKIYTIEEKLLNYRCDLNTIKKRRKYHYRLNEAKIRYSGFKKLHLFPRGYLYVLKPLIVGLIPTFILTKIKKEVKKC